MHAHLKQSPLAIMAHKAIKPFHTQQFNLLVTLLPLSLWQSLAHKEINARVLIVGTYDSTYCFGH